MIKTALPFILIFFSSIKLYSQIVAEFVPSENDFKELKKDLKDKDVITNNLEKSFLDWNFNILEPLLSTEIKNDTELFFKTHSDSITKYSWEKETHYGPNISFIPGGNFGLTEKSNVLRLHSTNENMKTLEIKYSYYIKDSTLTIYSIESHRYPYNNALNSTLPTVSQTEKLIQSLRTAVSSKNTKDIKTILSEIESMESDLSELPIFNSKTYRSQLSSHYSNLSWYLIFEKKYTEAIKFSEKGLKIDNQKTFIYTNLALSNLLAGNKEVALNIYKQYKDKKINKNKSFNDAFKEDLKEVLDANLIDSDLYNYALKYLD